MFTRNKYLVRFQPWFDYRQFFCSQHALHKYRQFCLFNLKTWDHRTNISQVQETSSKTSTLAIQVSGSWGLRLNQGNSVKMIWCIENVDYLQCFYSSRLKSVTLCGSSCSRQHHTSTEERQQTRRTRRWGEAAMPLIRWEWYRHQTLDTLDVLDVLIPTQQYCCDTFSGPGTCPHHTSAIYIPVKILSAGDEDEWGPDTGPMSGVVLQKGPSEGS